MDLKGTTILVTGGSGFVGGRIAGWLAAQGAHVRAVVRRKGVHPGLESPNVTQVQGDFVERDVAARVCEGATLVVHAAGTLGVDFADARRVNVSGTAVISAAARAAGCRRFVHISTIGVYAPPDNLMDVDETCPQVKMPATAGDLPSFVRYGITKAGAEKAVEAEIERGLPGVILRPGAILGVHPTSTWSVLMPGGVRTGQIPLRGDGSDLLPWTHIENVIEAVRLALTADVAVGREYNVVDGYVTWAAFIKEIRSWFPEAPSPRVIPPESLQPTELWYGNYLSDRIRGELGYVPVRTYADGMKEAADYWKKPTK
jgi:nucleoside-diphosphate-sugar epimerase